MTVPGWDEAYTASAPAPWVSVGRSRPSCGSRAHRLAACGWDEDTGAPPAPGISRRRASTCGACGAPRSRGACAGRRQRRSPRSAASTVIRARHRQRRRATMTGTGCARGVRGEQARRRCASEAMHAARAALVRWPARTRSAAQVSVAGGGAAADPATAGRRRPRWRCAVTSTVRVVQVPLAGTPRPYAAEQVQRPSAGNFGPRRVSQDELRAAFRHGWTIVSIEILLWSYSAGTGPVTPTTSSAGRLRNQCT